MRVLMLGIVLAIAAAVPTTSSADDQQIAEFIKTKLLQEKQRGNLFGFNVDMRVDRGTVWFKGFVSNRSQELMILRTAQLAGHLGVVQVVDDIEVNESFAATSASPTVRQDVRQQQAVMTSVPNQQPALQVQNQPMMQPPTANQPMMQPPMANPQMTQQQMMQQMIWLQQNMQQQPMPPGQNGQTPVSEGNQGNAPVQQIAPPAPHRAGMGVSGRSQSEMQTATQSAGFQEPVLNGDWNTTGDNYQQSMNQAPMQDNQSSIDYGMEHGQANGSVPSFQQNLLNAVRSPQSQTSNMAPPESIKPAVAVNAPVRLVSSNSQPLPFARAAPAAQGCQSCPNGGGGMMPGMMQGAPMADCGYGADGCGGPNGPGFCGPDGGGFGGPGGGGFGGPGGGGFGGADAGGFAGGDGMNSDSANLPGYAWPSYAAHPNYGAVSYPKQYSPSAWPYIGPFYPYPQVPLGWRKVALEWDDGWWFLDFNDKNH